MYVRVGMYMGGNNRVYTFMQVKEHFKSSILKRTEEGKGHQNRNKVFVYFHKLKKVI